MASAVVTYQVFIMANPRSGSQQAVSFLREPEKKIFYEFNQNKSASVTICNLLETEEVKSVFAEMKEIQEKNRQSDKIILVSAGGDGTLIGVLMNAKSQGVIVSEVVCVTLPYGTGNDTARVLGWGGTPNSEIYSSTKNIVREICLNSQET